MSTLTCVERLVLESLGQAPKDIQALLTDTQLELRFLVNILHALTLRGYIVRGPSGYAPNPHLPATELAELASSSAAKSEVLELVDGMCQQSDKKIGLRKAWVSEKDRAILRALLKNVEDFMLKLPPAPKGAALHEYTLVFWGEDQYGDVVKRLIGGVA